MTDAFAYDVLEYPAHVYQQMLPSLLAPIARLHGIDAASPKRCRLLEVGCGDGLQLLTLAQAYPDSQFVGVDLSATAITRGEAWRSRLGLDNLRLIAADLMTWDPGDAEFDYILSHGFFSWVPEPVRLRLLELCRQLLAPAGVAYISYNAFPGCHLRRMVWDMMRFHVRGIEAPGTRIERAREFLAWLGHDVVAAKNYADAVRAEALDLLQKTHPSVLFHDDLAQVNQPYAFADFAELAGNHGLQYLAEADYCEMSDAVMAPEAAARLQAMAGRDRIAKEQHLDFLKGRRFRQTLLCRAEAPMRPEVDLERLPALEVVGDLAPQPSPADPDADDTLRFASPSGAVITSNHASVKAVLGRIGEAFPAPLPVHALLDDHATGQKSRADVLEALGRAFQHGLVSPLCDPAPYAREAGAMPMVSPLARLQLESGASQLASLRPATVQIEHPVTRELLLLLDGSRDRDALLRDLAQRMACVTPPEGEPARDAAWWREMLAPQLEPGLRQVANMALLLPDR